MVKIFILAAVTAIIFASWAYAAITDAKKLRNKYRLWREDALRDGAMSKPQFDTIERFFNEIQ